MTKCQHRDCDGNVVAIGYCNKHYLRLKKYGSPDGGVKNHAPLQQRFWRKVKKTNGCWIWSGGKKPNGYGQISEGGRGSKCLSAHRVSYELHNGPIPDGLVVMHSCDNPACVNPAHLSLGTHKDNSDDMIAKGRKRTVAPLGSSNGKAILTEQDVLYIRANKHKSHAQLGREIGVSPNCVRGVRIGRTWSHIK